MPQLPVRPASAQIYAGGTFEETLTLINQDPVNPVYIGETKSVSVGGSDADVIPPLGSITYPAARSRFAAAPENTASLIVTDARTLTGAPQSLVPLESFTAFDIAAGQNEEFGPFPVSSYQSIFAAVRGLAGQISAAVDFYADQALTELTDPLTWQLNTGCTLNVFTPIAGAYCQVVLTELTGIAPATGDIAIAGTDVPATAPTYPVRPQSRIWGTPRSVPAASTGVFQIPGVIIGGTGYLYINPGDTAGKLDYQIGFIDTAGNVQSIIDDPFLTPPAAKARAVIPMPDAQNLLALIVTNSDSAAHTFTGALTIIPA